MNAQELINILKKADPAAEVTLQCPECWCDLTVSSFEIDDDGKGIAFDLEYL